METQASLEVEQDGEGNSILSLGRKSVQPFRTQDEYLYAMKEDLAEWFKVLYKNDLSEEALFDHLETGVMLCEHANNVNDHIAKVINGTGTHDMMDENGELPRIQFRPNVRPGSFQCRDNISNFIAWCRFILNIPDTLLFESDDLVMRKNERNVVLCLLEVARKGARYGMIAPVLIQLEEEIDAEIAGEEPPPRPVQPPRPRRTNDMMSLDEMVREIAGRCTCPDEFPIVRISEGKYKVGESLTLIFVRILRNHVMVRIGGGWDTLENYLNRHDPCRCNNVQKGYSPRRPKTPSNRRSSTPVGPHGPGCDVTAPRKLPATPGKSEEPSSAKSSLVRRNSSATPRNVERLRQSDEFPSSKHSSTSRPKSPATARRVQSPVPAKRPSSPSVYAQQKPADRKGLQRRHSMTGGNLHKHLNSEAPAVDKRVELVKPQPKRPASAGPASHSRTLSRDTPVSQVRGRSPAKDASHIRSRSVGASELQKHLIKSATVDIDTSNQVLMVSRGKDGHQIMNMTDGNLNRSLPNGPAKGTDRTMNSLKVRLGADRLLPSKPKNMIRSQSMESTGKIDKDSDESCSSSSSELNVERPRMRRQTSQSSVGSLGSTIEETTHSPPPAADTQMNEHMERLFEEYRRIEKGWIKTDDQELNDIEKKTEPKRKLPASPATKSVRPGSAGLRKVSAPSQQSTMRPTGRETPTSSRRSSLSASSSSSSISNAFRQRPSTPPTQRRPITPCSRNSPPGTPRAQRRSVTPVRPVPIRPTPVYANSSNEAPASMKSHTQQVNRNASMSRDRSQTRYRSQTPNPESSQPHVQTPARCKTPVVKMKTDGVQSRIDTGLKKRSTTPVSVTRTNSQRVASAPARRASSLSRAAINKQMGADSQGLSTPRPRSRSREDLLDSGTSGERTSRAESVRKRDMVQNSGRRSSSREVRRDTNSEYYNGDVHHAENRQTTSTRQSREPTRSLPPTPGAINTDPLPEPVTVEIPGDATCISNPDSSQYNAKPRRDDRHHSRTRIPRPASAQSAAHPDQDMNTLKRFDSGVDINISPTETSSFPGDEDGYLTWKHEPEALSLSPRAVPYNGVNNNSDDEYY